MDTAVLLSAGKGVRLLPYTKDLPKCLVPINGKPFLSYLISTLQNAGITRYIVVVGHQKEKLISYFRDNALDAVFVEQPNPKGTGDALRRVKSVVDRDSFLVLGSDNLWNKDDFHGMAKLKTPAIGAFCSSHPERYGVLQMQGDRLIRILEKPKVPPSALINTGLYRFDSSIFPFLDRLKPSPRGEIELTDAINALAADQKVEVFMVKRWLDLGRPEDIPLLEKEVR